MLQWVCHICRRDTEVAYCGICKHFLCPDCRKDVPARGWAWFEEQIRGSRPGCCGPVEVE